MYDDPIFDIPEDFQEIWLYRWSGGAIDRAICKPKADQHTRANMFRKFVLAENNDT